jgi:hypothetical protein
MRVYHETLLQCPPDKIWDSVQSRVDFQHITSPMVKFRPYSAEEPLPERWQEGSTVRCRPYALGVWPLGVHTLLFERIDRQRREMQTREHSASVKKWDHLIRVREGPTPQTCLYSDDVEIDAGWQTILTVGTAHLFYLYRQSRWRALARRLAQVA